MAAYLQELPRLATQAKDWYVANLPERMPGQIAHSFLFGAALVLISEEAVGVALLGGAMAATSTLVSKLCVPLIKRICPNEAVVELVEVVAFAYTAFQLESFALPYFGEDTASSLFAGSALSWLSVNIARLCRT